MKHLLLFVVDCIGFFSFTTLDSGRDEIVNALKTANVDQFTKYFDNNLDVKLPGGEEMKGIGKAQAASSVKNFFSTNNISSCTITSQRENGGTMYVTGKLNGASSYNITAMIKSSGDKAAIITVRINN